MHLDDRCARFCRWTKRIEGKNEKRERRERNVYCVYIYIFNDHQQLYRQKNEERNNPHSIIDHRLIKINRQISVK